MLPIKKNRKVSLSTTEKRVGKYVSVDSLGFKGVAPITVYLEGLTFPVVLMKHVYKNEDGSEGVLYLCASDLTLTSRQMLDLYQKRWKIEEYHKALKQECALSESPAHTAKTQASHIYCSMCAFVKLERLHTVMKKSYEGIKLMLHRWAVKSALTLLQNISFFYSDPKLHFA